MSRTLRSIAVVALGFVFGDAILWADAPAAVRAFEFTTSPPASRSGRWLSGTERTAVILEDGQTRTLANLQRVQSTVTVRPTRPMAVVQITSGDRLIARTLRWRDDQLHVTLVEGLLITIPLACIQSIVGPAGEADEAGQLWRLSPATDLLRLDRGESLSGDVEQLESTELRFRPLKVADKLARVFDWQRVRGIAFARGLLERPTTAKDDSLWILNRGSIVTAGRWERTAEGETRIWPVYATGDAPEGVVVKDESLLSVDFFGPDRELLTNQKYTTTHAPSLLDPLPPQTNRNVRGDSLQVRGRPAARGFGVECGTTLEFRLERQFHTLQTAMAVDDAATDPFALPAVQLEFLIEVDDRMVFRSAPQTVASPFLTIPPIDVREAQRLRLTVRAVNPVECRGFGNWIMPVLTK